MACARVGCPSPGARRTLAVAFDPDGRQTKPAYPLGGVFAAVVALLATVLQAVILSLPVGGTAGIGVVILGVLGFGFAVFVVVAAGLILNCILAGNLASADTVDNAIGGGQTAEDPPKHGKVCKVCQYVEPYLRLGILVGVVIFWFNR
jgi:hypothetical protein